MPRCSNSERLDGMCQNCYCDSTRGFKEACSEDDLEHIKCEFKDDKKSLYKAVIDRDLNKVKEILRNKDIDINKKSWYRGWTALHFAVIFMNIKTIILFLENGADVNIKNNTGKTPIDLCTTEEKKSILNNFLKMENFSKKFQNNFETKISNIFKNDEDDCKKEELIINLLNEFKNEHILKNINKKISHFFERKFINNIEFEEEKYSILHIAVLKKMNNLVEFLVKNDQLILITKIIQEILHGIMLVYCYNQIMHLLLKIMKN